VGSIGDLLATYKIHHPDAPAATLEHGVFYGVLGLTEYFWLDYAYWQNVPCEHLYWNILTD
jgi:hypothetical protein